jgi:hypothetical protein
VHWAQLRPYFKDVIETYNDRSITEIEIRTAALNCLPVDAVPYWLALLQSRELAHTFGQLGKFVPGIPLHRRS